VLITPLRFTSRVRWLGSRGSPEEEVSRAMYEQDGRMPALANTWSMWEWRCRVRWKRETRSVQEVTSVGM
jgi:hypothetical protein